MNWINEFLLYISNEKRYSLNTVDAYKRDLMDFYTFLNKESIQFEEVNESIVKTYLANLYVNKLSKRTISRKIATLKSFYKYLFKKKIVSNYFMATIKSPKKDRLLPNVIYKDEIDKIINYKTTGKYKFRDKSIIYLLYSSGLRISELCNIEMQNINFESRYISVLGKGNKSRIVPFNTQAKEAIENYIYLERNKLVSEDYNFLFVNKYGKRITPRSVQNMVSKMSLKLFSSKRIHPHLFRHTYATTLLNNGADLRVVQELLGHSNLTTTQVYTHVANKDIANSYKIFHPRVNS